ncbi:unnamed protein product [Closterium sp. Yama58-4]|nr:unnamed protein product [Closterium sp. Yama58-4]
MNLPRTRCKMHIPTALEIAGKGNHGFHSQRPCSMGRGDSGKVVVLCFLNWSSSRQVHAARSGNLKDEMFAMFDAKDEGQLSDDDLLLQSWDDLKRPSKFYNGYNEVDHYMKQGNLAEYLGLKAVRAIHVPIPVNLIFIGFNASTHHGMHMREGDMRRWLQRMDHVEEHTRAPLNWPSLLARLARSLGAGGTVGGEVVRSYDDDEDEEEGEEEGGELEHDLPLISSVHYNYTVHVMEMGERVASVFEAAVRTLSRPDDPTAAAASDDDDDPADSPPHPHHPSSSSASSASSSGAGEGAGGQQQWHQVDMGAMAHVVDSLVDSLQLDASAYNVLVLNLNRARARKRYGYRLGLSTAEFNMLKADDRLRQHLLSPGLEKVPQVLDEQHVPQPLFSSRPGHKLAWRHIEPHEILPWVARVTSLLGTVERVVSERGDPRANAARKAQQLLTSGDPRRARALRAALQEAAQPGGEDASWQEQCLTDTWIGTRSQFPIRAPHPHHPPHPSPRWALIDLSAGPFSWGPLSPSAPRAAAAAAAAGTPIAPVNTAAVAGGVRKERLEAVEEGEGEGEGQHAVDVLLAELDVYQAFAARHCSHRAVPSALCRELQQKLEEVKDDLAQHQGGSATAGSVFTGRSVRAALERLHSWKFQSVPPDRHAGKGEAGESSPAVTRAWDMLMAELAATLASAMSHVITPSTAAGAYHFYERVSFHLYVISHQAYYERRHTPQYVENFKAELQKLCLPGQRFHFSTYRLSVAEDAALATAFSASLRAAVLPSASAAANASAGGRVQLYLDSHVLQHQLRSLGDDSIQRLKRTRGERAQTCRCFSSPSHQTPSSLTNRFSPSRCPTWCSQCSCRTAIGPPASPATAERCTVTCGGDPLAAVLAATMEHLAGLLPAHISFSAAHSSVVQPPLNRTAPMQDWRWAAGGHPLAAIGGGLLGGGGASSAHVSELQRDAMARSFVVTALDEAVATVNRAIAHLAAETTREHRNTLMATVFSVPYPLSPLPSSIQSDEDTYAVFKRWERQLAGQYNAVVEGWRRVAAAVEAMDYGGALQLLPGIESAAARWVERGAARLVLG